MKCLSLAGGFSLPLPLLLQTMLISPFHSLWFLNSDVKQTTQSLSPSKCVGQDEIPSLTIKACSNIFSPLLSHIFNIVFLQEKFPSLWKQAAVLPVSKNTNSALITNCKPIIILNNFSKNFEGIIHDQLSFILNQSFAQLNLILLNQNLLEPIYLLKLCHCFCFTVFKNKTDSFLVDTVGLRAITQQIQTAANISKSLDVIYKRNISIEDTFLFA